jgi:hypothetical protein
MWLATDELFDLYWWQYGSSVCALSSRNIWKGRRDDTKFSLFLQCTGISYADYKIFTVLIPPMKKKFCIEHSKTAV